MEDGNILKVPVEYRHMISKVEWDRDRYNVTLNPGYLYGVAGYSFFAKTESSFEQGLQFISPETYTAPLPYGQINSKILTRTQAARASTKTHVFYSTVTNVPTTFSAEEIENALIQNMTTDPLSEVARLFIGRVVQDWLYWFETKEGRKEVSQYYDEARSLIERRIAQPPEQSVRTLVGNTKIEFELCEAYCNYINIIRRLDK